jgi:hypothetical protein
MTNWKGTLSRTARALTRNGAIGCLLAAVILLAAPPTAGAHGFTGPLAWALLLAFCLLALALSVHLLFDAALFRLALSHEEEEAGLAAVDDVLDRMGLRARSATPAPLAARLAGCRRLVWLQRAALAVGLGLFLVLLLDGTDGACPC